MNASERSKQVYERLTPNYFQAIISITTIIALISFILLLRELKQRLAVQALLETRVNTLGQANNELQQIAYKILLDTQKEFAIAIAKKKAQLLISPLPKLMVLINNCIFYSENSLPTH